jgi:hypothetical protein
MLLLLLHPLGALSLTINSFLDSRQGLEVIEMMKKEGVLPDVVTYTALLDACLNSLRAAGVSVSGVA